MSLPVVPDGFGYGMDTRAAYGGGTDPDILRVTNLNDSGAGSLRAALTASGPRVVIFETSGTIVLGSDIYVTNPYLTVAGQTAPSPGITLRGYGIWIYSHDILLQHFRVRPGDTGAVSTGQGIRAGVYEDGAYNIVLDHLSVSWTNDEGTIVAKTFAGNPGTSDANVAFWRCLIGEGLNYTARESNSEGKGLAVNYHSRKVSAIQNVYVSSANRLPLVKGGTSVYFANNLAYNWSFNPPATCVDPVEDGIQNGPFFVSLIGNHYRTGPSWDPSGAYMSGSRYAQTGSQLYLSDNLRDAVGGTLNEFLVVGPDGIDPRVGSPPLSAPSGYTPIASSDVQALVLANAGARPLDRDIVDQRLINDVTNRTGSSTLHSQSEVGGWPSLAVNTQALTTPASPHAVAASGYTNLEEWLHDYAGEAATPGMPTPTVSEAFVNSTGKQNFNGSSVTSIISDAWSLTAGNLAVVILRTSGASSNPADFGCTDSLGNSYGTPIVVLGNSLGWAIWICNNCLGGSATVTVTHPSATFTAITGLQFSGQPASVAADRVFASVATGGSVSCLPSSVYSDQIAIIAADVGTSSLPDISATDFVSVYTSGPAGNGPFVGVGSHRVGYNVNASRTFDGSETVSATAANGHPMSIVTVIVRQAPTVGVPVSTPLAAQTPCTPQTTVSNGGKGKAGCNPGGVGGGHQYDVADGVGDVPQHADPYDGETLTGDRGIVLEPWLELVHTDYPSGDKTTYRRAFEELADDATYEGGRKEAGVLAIGVIEHGLGNEQGGFEAASVDLELSDIRDRLIRELAVDQDFDGDEARIKMASDVARAAATFPRVLLRGIVQKADLESTLRSRLTVVDWLFSDFGPFGPNRKDPNWTFNDLGSAAPDMTSDTKAQAIPLLYGEKSDEGAVDPLTLAVAPKGLLPGFYLGLFDLSAFFTPDAVVTTGRTLEALIAIMVQLVADAVPPVSWVDTIGFDLGTDDITNMLDKTGNTIPTTFEALASYLGSEDVKAALLVGTTAAPTATTWGFIATGLGPWFQYTGVYGSDLGGGDAQKTHDRVKLDPATRSDVLIPGVNWPFDVPYFELTNPDTGRTFWLTGIFARGALLDDHVNGVVNFSFNAIGIEANGDGSGLPILRVEDAKQHRLENHYINQWSSGAYADVVTYPQFNDGVPMVRSSSFRARQNWFKTQLGSEGILVSWYTDKQQSTLDVVRQWNRDTEGRTGVNQHGQIVDFGFDETVDTSTWPRLNHVTDVFGSLVRTAGEERENVVTGSCDFDPDFEKYRTGPFTFTSATGVQKYKNRIKQGTVIESQMLYDPSHFTWILQRRLARLQFGTTLIEVTVSLNPWANYDVGQGLLLTSEDGPGPSGYVDREFIILRRKTDIVQGLLTLTLWDVHDLLALYAGSSPILDVVFDDVTGAIVYDDVTGETVYADAN